MTSSTQINLYKHYIYDKYKFIKNSNKTIDNYDLCKIFEPNFLEHELIQKITHFL